MSMLKKEGEDMLDEVRKLCAYETEKKHRLKCKLREKLMDGILVEEMRSFTSFFSSQLPPNIT